MLVLALALKIMIDLETLFEKLILRHLDLHTVYEIPEFPIKLNLQLELSRLEDDKTVDEPKLIAHSNHHES